jgi:ribose-phosphate pyrophosphokinase
MRDWCGVSWRGVACDADKKSRYIVSAASDFAKMLEVVGVDRVIAVDLQRPGHPTESVFFHVPVETLMTTDLGVEYYAKSGLLADSPKVTVVAPNPETVRKAQIFRHGLTERFMDQDRRVGFAMFSRAPVADGNRVVRESELLGDVEGADVILVDEIIDTANTLSE